jgi:hypothetical protein
MVEPSSLLRARADAAGEKLGAVCALGAQAGGIENDRQGAARGRPGAGVGPEGPLTSRSMYPSSFYR